MSDPAESVQLDLNNPVFQRQWFALPKEAQWSVLGTLRKLVEMTWSQVYQDCGLRWEIVHTHRGPHGGRLYSFCTSQGFRGLAYRESPWMRLLSLHPDHDTAYRS
jgi:hypothetical protein